MLTSWSNNLPEKSIRSITDFEFLHDPNDKNAKLGIGSFATVKLAKDKKTNKMHALKLISVHPSKATASDLHNLRTEIIIHRKLDHPNIIKYYEYFQNIDIVYLVLDYAEKGNLYSYMHKKKGLNEDESFKYFYETCLAIQYMHNNNFLHRDLKPENLLLDKDNNIKLCDFGWAAQNIKDKRSTFCGTYEYMAPEIVFKQTYDYRVDIWSLGILLFELLHREAPFKGRNLAEITKSMQNPTINFGESINPDAKDLICNILKFKPEERYSIEQILNHEWVKKHSYLEESLLLSRKLSPKIPKKSIQCSKTPVIINERIEKRDFKTSARNMSSLTPEPKVKHQQSSDNYENPSITLRYENFEKIIPKPLKSPSFDNINSQLKEKENIRDYMGVPSSSGGSLNHIHTKSPNNVLTLKLITTNINKNPDDYSHSTSMISKLTKSHTFQVKGRILDLNSELKTIGKSKIFDKSMLSPNFKNKLDKIITQLNTTRSNTTINNNANTNTNTNTNINNNINKDSIKSPQNKILNIFHSNTSTNFNDNNSKKREKSLTDGSYILSKQYILPNNKKNKNIEKETSIHENINVSRPQIFSSCKQENENHLKLNDKENFLSPRTKINIGSLTTKTNVLSAENSNISGSKPDDSINMSKSAFTTKAKAKTTINLVKEDCSLKTREAYSFTKKNIQVSKLENKNLREVDLNRGLSNRNGSSYNGSKTPIIENGTIKLTFTNFYKGLDSKRKNYSKGSEEDFGQLNPLRSVDRHHLGSKENEPSYTMSSWGSFTKKKAAQLSTDLLNFKKDESKIINSKFLEKLLNNKMINLSKK